MPDNSVSPEDLSQAKKLMLEGILGKPTEGTLPGKSTYGKSRPVWRMAAVAAAVFTALLLGRVWLYPYRGGINSSQAYASNVLIQSDSTVIYVRLPDSSGVWVNAHSRLSYDAVSFAAKERRVSLQGEAYFEVTKDPTRPFVVISGAIATRVLGTGFNVQTYQQDELIKITLIHGSISVNDSSAGKSTLLQPHQQLQYHRKSKTWNVMAFNHNPAQNWMNGGLSFRDATLSEVLDDVAHQYNVTIGYDHQTVVNKRVTIDIKTHNNIDTVLKSILFVHRLHYTYKDSQVFIY
ncbi:FecR family protein [Chitinophaga sp. ARDCPP14]|uniref:FecR family protein n=1 Tax=Chitinophaga sp. ARDCPP14 TaxID=3391139 RepID=UPI003F51E8EA